MRIRGRADTDQIDIGIVDKHTSILASAHQSRIERKLPLADIADRVSPDIPKFPAPSRTLAVAHRHDGARKPGDVRHVKRGNMGGPHKPKTDHADSNHV